MAWRDGQDDYHVDEVEALRETEMGLLVKFQFEHERTPVERWIPKSQISPDSEVCENGDLGTLIVSLWFAKQAGWPT